MSKQRFNKVILELIFKVNKLIEMELEVPGKAKSERSYIPTRIERITSNSIVVSAPCHNGFLIPLRIGDSVSIRIYRFGALYSCDVKVMGRMKESSPVLQLSFPQTIHKVQLRKWVRVKADIPVCYCMAGYQVDYYRALTSDISGGGVSLLTTHLIDIDTRLNMMIILPDNSIEVIGQVRRCSKDKNADYYKTGIQFENIDEKNLDELVSFILLKQREIIQKGILDYE